MGNANTNTTIALITSVHLLLGDPREKNMYKKTDCLLLPYSTSAVYNNIAIKSKQNGIEEAAVIHLDTVSIVPTKNSFPHKTRFVRCSAYTNEKVVRVTQVTWGSLNYETVLFVTSTLGLQVFSQPEEECLFFHPCTDTAEKTDYTFARGIAIFNSMYFCVGNSSGSIRLFGSQNLDNEFYFIDRKQNHNFPISDLSAYKRNLASVDEEGYITLWYLDAEELSHKITIPSKNCCTGIKLKRDWLITTYASGCIQLYAVHKESPFSMLLSVEVAAHARAITGLDVTENNEYLLTTSEDKYAKIWQFYKDGSSQMLKHVANVAVEDSMLMGGKFLTSNGNKFCVVSYDSNVVNCFST